MDWRQRVPIARGRQPGRRRRRLFALACRRAISLSQPASQPHCDRGCSSWWLATRTQPGAMAGIEAALLQALAEGGSIADSGDFASAQGQEHLKVVGVIKSLEAAEMVVVEVRASGGTALRCCCRRQQPLQLLACAIAAPPRPGRCQPAALFNCCCTGRCCSCTHAGHQPLALCADA